MRKINTAALFILGFGLIFASQGMAATTSSSVGAEIVSAITITNTTGLHFGQIAPSSSAGTVTISTAGVRTSAGGVTLGNQVSVSACSFDIAGAPNNTYSITLPADGTITLTSGGSPAMAVDTFVSSPATTGTLDGSGAQILTVGATLSVGANQPNGNYTGMFNVTVAYN